jgi:hypothetical protein
MTSTGAPLRAALATALGLLSSAAARVRGLLAWAWSLAVAAFARARSRVAAGVARTRDVLDGPVRRVLAGPVRTALLGRRVEVSLVVVLLAPLLAAGAAWWVGSIGFGTLVGWAEGTWTGTDPNSLVLLSAAALVALAAVSAAVNSGLVPTSLLVAGPLFGAAVVRYGTTVERTYGTHVVSLPEAVGVAALLAIAVGLPLALVGFVLGAAARRVVRVFADEADRSAGPERI